MIARMDADDIAKPERLARQVDVLAAGHGRAARQALALARRQGSTPARTRVKICLLWLRACLYGG
jgi:hypothetical protein